VLKAWEGLGYYSRARNLHRAVREVVERYGGRVPDDPAEFRSLPGVGRYTGRGDVDRVRPGGAGGGRERAATGVRRMT
jgi:adenine-specific DNA glycosylase